MSDLDDLLGEGGLSAFTTAGSGDATPAPEIHLEASAALTVATELGVSNEMFACGANTPFFLEGETEFWLILAGGLDVFYLHNEVDKDMARPIQTRTHMARIESGGAAFGFSPPSGARVQAIAINGSKIVKASIEGLQALLSSGDALPVVAELIDGWTESLSNGVAPSSPSGYALPLAAGMSGQFQKETMVQAARAPVWLQLSANEYSLWGIARSTTQEAQGDCLVPITRYSRLDCKEALHYKVVATPVWLRGADFMKDMYAYHRLCISLMAHNQQQRLTMDVQHFSKSADSSRLQFVSALRSLAAVIGKSGGVLQALHPTALIGAAQIVARKTGFELSLKDDVSIERVLQAKDPIETLARFGGFFARKISFEGRWWREDHGPMMAFYGEDNAPCALIPRSAHAYDLIDPSNDTRVVVTDELAIGIASPAYQFYAPFPSGKLSPMDIFRFGLRGTGRDIMTVIATLLFAGLLSLALPIATGWVMDPIIPEAQFDQLLTMIMGLVIAAIAMSVFGLVQSFAMLRTEGRMTNAVQAAVWDRLLKLPASFFQRYSVGDLVNRAQGIDAMRQLISGAVITSLGHAIIGLFSLGLMLYYDWHLTAITVVVAFIFSVITYFIGRKVLARVRDLLALSGRLQGVVLQLLGSVSKLRIAGAEQHAFSKWAGLYAQLQSISFEQRNLNNLLVVFKSGFSYFAVFGIIFVLGWQGQELLAFYHTPTTWAEVNGDTLKTVMPTARFISFYVAYGQFMAAVFGLTQIAIQLLNIKPLYERVEPILSEGEESDEGSEDPGEISGAVQVHNVHFRYREDLPLALEGLSFKAKPGQFIAFVGPSGAGKSSLVRLLLGFEKPESGSVFLDGRDIAGLDKRSMRRGFGVVLQNGRVLSGTVFHNITAGANLSHDDAWEAARLAGLDKDIEAMPMGMETYLGEGATTLSGGQRQRLMIARAIVHHPRVIIFDEATSALDNETQAIVQEGLNSLNSTRIVIAHRLSTIINADMIYAIDKGKNIEMGTYKQLMERDGFFAAMVRRQLA